MTNSTFATVSELIFDPNQAIACSVCEIQASNTLQLEGRTNCPSGYNLEYLGVLAARSGERGTPGISTSECFSAITLDIVGEVSGRNETFIDAVQALCSDLLDCGEGNEGSGAFLPFVVCSK